MATAPSKQALRDQRKKDKQCIHCGLPAEVRNGKTLTRCAQCKERDGKNRQRYAERDEAVGICRNTGCSRKTTESNKYCDYCNSKSAGRTEKRRKRHVESGICAYCPNPRLPGLTRCAICNEKLKKSNEALAERRVAEGMCGRCGKRPVAHEGYRRCQVCIDEGIKRHADIKRQVLDAYGGPVCVGCGEDCIAVLQIDHIGGGGHKHALRIGDGDCARGRGKMYRHLRDSNFPPGYRVLCPTCNVKAARSIPFPSERTGYNVVVYFKESYPGARKWTTLTEAANRAEVERVAAAWRENPDCDGAYVVLAQTDPESPPIPAS